MFFSIGMPGTLSGPEVVKRSLQQIDAVRELNRLGVMVDISYVSDRRRPAGA